LVDWDKAAGNPPIQNLGLNTTQLSFGISCGSPEGCFDNGSGSAYVAMYRIEMVLRDLAPPESVGAPEGTLLMSGPRSGLQQLSVAYTDRGGGLKSGVLLVDNVARDEKVVTGTQCAPPYTTVVPCSPSGRLEFSLGTTSIPDGEHRIELELRDVAGNRTIVGPYPIVVRNQPVLAPPDTEQTPGIVTEPTAESTAIPVRVGRLSIARPTIKGRYGGDARIGGRLVGLGDEPIPGATIDVASRVRTRTSSFASLPPVVTGADGRFSVPVKVGPSQVVRLRYGTSEASADVLVPAPVKLTVTPRKTRNLRSIRFSGGVPESAPARTRVELQAWSGGRWVLFRTAPLHNDRFHARYRFTNTTHTTRYRFRAIIHSDDDLPYTAGESPVVKVLVRP
jgi:hypothetical protein